MGGCQSCESIAPPNPQLVGLWISDDATDRSNLLHNFDWEKRTMQYGCSKKKRVSTYKPCTGAVLEIEASGYVRYVEMDGVWATSVYSGPITNWDGPDGVWTGCCVGCCGCCCRKGCAHFDAVIPPVASKDSPMTIHVNGRNFSKAKDSEVEQGSTLELGSGLGTVANICFS